MTIGEMQNLLATLKIYFTVKGLFHCKRCDVGFALDSKKIKGKKSHVLCVKQNLRHGKKNGNLNKKSL